MKQANRILLVEGKNDKHVLWSLLEKHKVPECFKIQDKNVDDESDESGRGWHRILEDLDVELDRPGLECLGIVLDADENLSARWDAVRNRLLGLGYSETPNIPIADGTIIRQTGKPTVGIWLMPNNRLPGILEDFVALLIHDQENNPLWRHVKNSVTAIPESEVRFTEARKSKALIHTWLAWQEEPGKPLGQAITSRYLNADAPHAHSLIGWIRNLFLTTDFA